MLEVVIPAKRGNHGRRLMTLPMRRAESFTETRRKTTGIVTTATSKVPMRGATVTAGILGIL
jgi:hypothetical protein